MRKLITIFILILIVSLIPYSVSAEDSLNINDWMVESYLLENGDLSIVEDITFQFNQEFNGVFRDIVLKGTDGIKELHLYELIAGKEVPYKLVDDANKGDTNVYMIIDDHDTRTVQIFSPSENESKSFRLKYTLTNVAVQHTDTGELFYKFLGDENNTPVDYFSATVNLPGFNREKIRIFGHGPLNGHIDFVGDNLIELQVENVDPNTFIEARILFPLDYIPNSSNVGNNSFNKIIEEEISYNQQIAEDAARREKQKDIFNNLSLIFSAAALATIGFFYNRFKRNPHIFSQMDSLYPEYISPAELSIFMSQGISTRTLLATLFDLSSRGYVTMEEIELRVNSKKKMSKDRNKDFLFKKLSFSTDNLLEHEIFLIDWLFSLGNSEEVSTLDIENYRKKHLSHFGTSLNTWTNKVRKDLQFRDYFDAKGKKASGYVFIVAFTTLLLGVFSAINEALYGILLIILSVALLIFAISLYTRKSDKGHIQYRLWEDFKKDMSFLEKGESDFSKDKSLIYAIALGLSMKELNDYRENISPNYYPMYWGYWYFMTNQKGGSLLEDRMGNSFYGSYGTSSSTSTGLGGGGGFSGGGGGGVGGGGAGGF